MKKYDYRNCQSLFGYAVNAHIRSHGQCQLCGCGGEPLDFDLWRQMTVEHIIGKSQGGYLKQISEYVKNKFPEIPQEEQRNISNQIDTFNTVTACSFCNSTTSRKKNMKSMEDLLLESNDSVDEILSHIKKSLQETLEQKRAEVKWKLDSIKQAFKTEFLDKMNDSNS